WRRPGTADPVAGPGAHFHVIPGLPAAQVEVRAVKLDGPAVAPQTSCDARRSRRGTQHRPNLRATPTTSSVTRCLRRHGWAVELHGSTLDLRRGQARYDMQVSRSLGHWFGLTGSTQLPTSVNGCIVP